MSDKKIWFGTLYDTSLPGTSATTSNAKMSWVPAPDTGMEAGSYGYSQVLEYESGGASVISSAAMHRRYEMDWNLAEASGAQGLDIIKQYQQDQYGPGLIFWANPMIFDQNVLAPALASPGLGQAGWEPVIPGVNTGVTQYIPTTANIYEQPKITARTSILAGGTALRLPSGANHIQVVAIPPTHSAWVGFSGTSSGNAVIAVRPILQSGAYDTIQIMTLLSVTGATRMNASFSGATYKAIEIYATSSTTASGSIDLTSAMCQLWPIGTTPILTGNHIPGQGDTGLRFTEAANVETYIMVDQTGTPRHYKGMSTSLTEVVRSTWA